MSDVSVRLARALADKELRPIDLAARSGIDKGSISHYLQGDNVPSGRNMAKLASALGVTVDWLLGKDDSQQMPPSQVPILGRVAAGVPIYAAQDVIGMVSFDGDPDGMFALKVKGDSMSPRLLDGDLVLAHKQEAAEDGDLVIALVEDEATCKILHRSAWGVSLIPFNPAYPPFTFAGEEADRLKILGKVIESRHEWK